MAVEKITLNLIPTGETPTIHAAQFDKERAFQIELKEGEDDFSPTGYDIELQVRKVDNNIVTAVPSQVSSNIVTFLTTEQMTACSGTNLAELQISKDNMSIATLHFYLVVQRDVLAGGLSSQSEIYDLEEQIAAIVPEVIGDEYYTADQVDEKIAEIPTFDPTNYYDKTQLYTKTETNGLLSQKANTSSLSTVATTGDYDDLLNKPTIPTNAEQLPITSGSATNTKEYIDNGLSDKADTSELYDILPTEQGSGAIAHFTDGADNIPVKSLSSEIKAVQDLHGYDKPWVGGAGKNKAYTNEGNNLVIADVKANTTYTFSCKHVQTQYNYGINLKKNNSTGEILISDSNNPTSLTFTPTDDCSVFINAYSYTSGVLVANVIKEYQVELGSTATSFEPYENICPITGFDNGVITVTDNDQITNTYTFAFGQTVYGGHFDNKGNFEVNKIKIHIDSSYTFSSELEYAYTNCNNLIKALNYTDKIICDKLITSPEQYGMPIGSISGYADKNNLYPNQNWLCFKVAETTTPQIMKDWLDNVGGIDVVYELDNPIVLPITSQDIPTLLGENNIYSNCGDVEVEYHADIGLYIDKKISSLAQG